MTDYTKSTNFATKDSLSPGSALKIVRGTEIDTEFNNIATAIATKYDSASTVPVTSGGTGATTASGARTSLGLVIGTNVQAWDADLDTWAGKTAPSGTVVGTTDTQTLTNKTIQGGAITSATLVASTSGTSIDFTSIPSWVKRITVMFNGVSTSGTSVPRVQIGDGAITTSGYSGTTTVLLDGATVNGGGYSGGFDIRSAVATNVLHGAVVITTLGSNIWVANGVLADSNRAAAYTVGGSKTLSGTLDRIRVTTTNGTDTFDAGSINILYEG